MHSDVLVIVFTVAVLIAFAINLYVMFMRGETVGTVKGEYENRLGGTYACTFVVKRNAKAKPRQPPTVYLRASVPMATGGRWLSATTARRIADAIEQAAGVGTIAPYADQQIAGIDITRVYDDGSIGCGIGNLAGDEVYILGRIYAAQAKELAGLIRIAAAPGATIAQARVNARRKQPA